MLTEQIVSLLIAERDRLNGRHRKRSKELTSPSVLRRPALRSGPAGARHRPRAFRNWLDPGVSLECKPRTYLNGAGSALTQALPNAGRRLAKRERLLRCRGGLCIESVAVSAGIGDVKSVEHFTADL